jgi:hypothetical protein
MYKLQSRPYVISHRMAAYHNYYIIWLCYQEAVCDFPPHGRLSQLLHYMALLSRPSRQLSKRTLRIKGLPILLTQVSDFTFQQSVAPFRSWMSVIGVVDQIFMRRLPDFKGNKERYGIWFLHPASSTQVYCSPASPSYGCRRMASEI